MIIFAVFILMREAARCLYDMKSATCQLCSSRRTLGHSTQHPTGHSGISLAESLTRGSIGSFTSGNKQPPWAALFWPSRWGALVAPSGPKTLSNRRSETVLPSTTVANRNVARFASRDERGDTGWHWHCGRAAWPQHPLSSPRAEIDSRSQVGIAEA